MKEKNKLIYIALAIVILILIAVNLQVFINNFYSINEVSQANNISENTQSTNQNVNTNYNTVSSEDEEQNRDKKVATLNETQRMQTYFGRYISYIESGDYQSAYALLYDGFKQNYFPTVEDFTTYAQNNYPTHMVVEYTNIERQGTIFILTVKIRDVLNSTTDAEVPEQQIVVTENDINDFYISFAVNEQ